MVTVFGSGWFSGNKVYGPKLINKGQECLNQKQVRRDEYMLKIFYGDKEDVIYNTSVYFKFNYDPEWFNDPEIVDMVKDIDKSTVIGNGAIDSPVLGVIAPVTLSGGLKTLILIDKVHNPIVPGTSRFVKSKGWS